MTSHVLVDRLQFTLTVTFHYIFPILTMGLALFVAWLKTVSYLGREDHRFPLWRKTQEERDDYESAARFWAKIFALNFAFGVVTGIPLEFQFGTNWAKFSTFAGGVIGQTLALEGIFAFFLESSFLGILLFGDKRFSVFVQWMATLMLFFGAWLSGYFIIATNAWMQHPVAYSLAQDGHVFVNSLTGLVTNPWIYWQYAHARTAAVVTSSCVMAAVGALYVLLGL